jgi:hypothetical protein
MVGKQTIKERVTPVEALGIFKNCTSEEMCIAMDLYQAYRQTRGTEKKDHLWDLLSLIAYAYVTGRVQGIREERAKKKGA